MKHVKTGFRLLPMLLLVLLLICGMTSTAMAANYFYFDKAYNTVFEGEALQLVLPTEQGKDAW